jgi:hypothetical protein
VAYGEQHWWLREGIFWLDTMLEGFKTLTLIRVGCVCIYIRKGVHGWSRPITLRIRARKKLELDELARARSSSARSGSTLRTSLSRACFRGS